MDSLKTYCVDLDGTLCTNTFGEYEKALPLLENIYLLSNLYESGHFIKIFTARGSSSGADWRELTRSQLSDWGVKYHELVFGKPEADFYIDDRGVNVSDWINGLEKSSTNSIGYFHSSVIDAASSMLKGTSQVANLARAAEIALQTILNEGTVFWCGNGGSAADSQHLAAELVGRFAKNRAPLRSIALTTDSSIITALSNDFGFETIFSRQLRALGKKNDVIFGISTSGNSRNVIEAFLVAQELGISTVSFTGQTECELDLISDVSIKAQTKNTAHIQESHIAWGQSICGYIESQRFPG